MSSWCGRPRGLSLLLALVGLAGADATAMLAVKECSTDDKPILKAGEVCVCTYDASEDTTGCWGYHCATVFATADSIYFAEMTGGPAITNEDPNDKSKRSQGQYYCTRVDPSFLDFKGESAGAAGLTTHRPEGMKEDDDMSAHLFQTATTLSQITSRPQKSIRADAEIYRQFRGVVAGFKAEKQPKKVNAHLSTEVLKSKTRLSPRLVAKWITTYGSDELFPEYEMLGNNCQQFSSYLYEALTDATWWSRRQATIIDVGALFAGKRADTGVVAIGGSVEASGGSTSEVPFASKGSSEVSKQGSQTASTEAARFALENSPEALMGGVTSMVQGMEKYGMLKFKLKYDKTTGQIVLPKPGACSAAQCDAAQVVGECSRLSSLGCWYSNPEGTFACKKDPLAHPDENPWKCYCKHWLSRTERALQGLPLGNKKFVRHLGKCSDKTPREISEMHATNGKILTADHCRHTYESYPTALEVCLMGTSIQQFIASKDIPGQVKIKIAIKSAQIAVGVATALGNTLVLAAVAGLSVTPFSAAVLPALGMTAIVLMLMDAGMKAKLSKYQADAEAFVYDAKALLRGFDNALVVNKDQEKFRHHLIQYAPQNHPVVMLLRNDALEAVIENKELKEYRARNNQRENNRITGAAPVSGPDGIDQETGLSALLETESAAEAALRLDVEIEAAVQLADPAADELQKWIDGYGPGGLELKLVIPAKKGSLIPAKKTPSELCLQAIQGEAVTWNSREWKTIVFPKTNEATSKEWKTYCGYLKMVQMKQEVDTSLRSAQMNGMQNAKLETFLGSFKALYAKLESAWPKDAKDAENAWQYRLLEGMEKVKSGLDTVNVFLAVGTGVAKIPNIGKMMKGPVFAKKFIGGTGVEVAGVVMTAGQELKLAKKTAEAVELISEAVTRSATLHNVFSSSSVYV